MEWDALTSSSTHVSHCGSLYQRSFEKFGDVGDVFVPCDRISDRSLNTIACMLDFATQARDGGALY